MVCGHCPPYVSAQLLAAAEIPSQLGEIITDATIGHNSLVENNIASTNIKVKHFGSSEVNPSEFPILGSAFFQLGSSEDSISDYRFKNTRLEENSVSKVSSLEINSFTGTFPEISRSEVSKTHVAIPNTIVAEFRISKIDISEDSTTEGGITAQENTLAHISSSEIGSSSDKVPIANARTKEFQFRQVESAKVSLPSIVSIQQLDNSNLSHDNTPLLNTIYSTDQILWHTNTPIDLNFAVTNLPTGQLAADSL
jgi:hypothetical protein